MRMWMIIMRMMMAKSHNLPTRDIRVGCLVIIIMRITITIIIIPTVSEDDNDNGVKVIILYQPKISNPADDDSFDDDVDA